MKREILPASPDYLALFLRSAFLVALSLLPCTALPTNSWVKSGDGTWEEPASWSLGVLPESSHSVAITNAGFHTVEITSTTALNHPASLTVNDLALAQNSLWINSASAEVPLRVKNNFSSSNATVLNRASSLVLENGSLQVQKGQFIQDGGLVQVQTGGVVLDRGGTYHLTNGVLEGAWLALGNGYDGFFNQYGGVVRVGQLSVSANATGSAYHLYEGKIIVSREMHVGSSFSSDSFFQHAGNVDVAGDLRVVSGSATVRYILESGFLSSSNLSLLAGFTSAYFQNNGTQTVTNVLNLRGSARYYPPIPNWAAFTNRGSLSARVLEMDEFSSLTISGTASISESIAFIGTDQYAGQLLISGTLACSNLLSAGANVDITQTGGAVIVSNRFSFAGWYPGIYNRGGRFARYHFSGGQISAKDIELAAEWIIGNSSQSGRINNTGTFTLGGILRVGDATEQFGEFRISTNATIIMEEGSARLSFADSSSREWRAASVLMISNWNGALSGGGDDQVVFGTQSSGLTSRQLAQVRFLNPASLPQGIYPAKILSTGEVIPDSSSILGHTSSGDKLALTWEAGFNLQTSTNVNGPYIDLNAVDSPYIIDFVGPQQFFRLHQKSP